MTKVMNIVKLLKKGREAYELMKNILLDGSIVLQDN